MKTSFSRHLRIQNGVVPVIDNVVSCHRGHAGALERVQAALYLDDVLFRQQLAALRQIATEKYFQHFIIICEGCRAFNSRQACVVHALADFLLHLVDGVAQLLCHGMAAERLDVEVVGLGREDKKCDDGHVRK